MAEQRLTASVVGGGTGGTLSMQALTASDRYNLIAAADWRPTVREALAERYAGIQTYADHTSMIAERPTDVVCVSTWPPTHQVVAEAALASGVKGLLCEKPLGDTAAAGRTILAAVRASGVPVVVPHGLLVMRHVEEIMQRVWAGEIGQIELIEIQCNQWDIINAGIHWLDFCVNLLPDDRPAWVMSLSEASTRTFRDGMQVETTAITYVETQGGVRFCMQTGDQVRISRPNKGMLLRLVGTLGTIEFWAWQSGYWLLNAAHPRGETFDIQPYAQSNHQRYLELLADAIAGDVGAAAQGLVWAERSLTALELCEGAYLSSARRCKVHLPLDPSALPPAPDWRPGQPYSGQGGGRDGRKL